MFIVDEITGDIITRQGDNGEYTIYNIPTDKDYKLYFSVFDENRNKIGDEILVNSLYKDFATFIITPEFSDKLTVKKGEESAQYNFAIKKCYGFNQIEDTLVLGNKTIYDKNTILVLPKESEGGL